LSDVIDLVSGGVRWQVRRCGLGDERDRLFGPDGLRLAEWSASGAARVVKEGPHRTVYRVVLPGLDFYLKCYPVSNNRAWLRTLVRPSKARGEHDRTLAVMARGVPTVEPLAVGESLSPAGPRASYLLTRTLPDAVPLNAFLEDPPGWGPRRRTRFRQRLARALGRLLARMHDAGVRHDDLHPGNILLRLEDDDAPRLYLIDLHAVRLGPPLLWPAARDNLVVLNRWFVLRSERGDRLRFWKAYRGARTVEGSAALPGDRRPDPFAAAALVRDLERRTLRSNLRFWRAHDRNCLGASRHFCSVRRGAVAGYAVADLDGGALARLLDAPDAPFRHPEARMLKDSASSSVVEFDLTTASGLCRVVYKRFAAGRGLDPLAALVRPTAALRSYLLGHGLRLRCLPTPRPLAVWHRSRRGLPCEGYLLTEKIPGAVHLRAFVDRLAGPGRLVRLRGLIDQVARLVRKLHERRLSHRDLKAPNLLVSPVPSVVTSRGIAPLGREVAGGGADQVWFIDLVGVRRHRRLGRRRRVQNLARLHVSFLDHPGVTRTDKLRFLRAYLAWGVRGRYGWKRWWQEVEEATRAKVRRNLRNGRPLG
jgi:tRNA A-37 threonylcarbamoyl transferase component Bud32